MRSYKVGLLPLLLLVMLCTGAFGAVTVTWNEPPDNVTYRNNPQNIQTLDLNFTVIDSNSIASDINITVYYWESTRPGEKTVLKIDWNAFDYTDADFNCVVAEESGVAYNDYSSPGRDCSFTWVVPTSLPDGTYKLDANAVEYVASEEALGVTDTNALRTITFSNELSGWAAVKSLLANNVLVLVGALLISLLVGAVILTTRPDQTFQWAVGSIMALIMVAIAAIIIGTVLTVM